MADIPLAPPIQGLDNRSAETALPVGAVRVARNVDISREGVVTTRPGARRIIDAPGVHSLYAGARGVYAVYQGVLQAVDVAAGTLTPIGALADDAPLSYTETALGTVFVSASDAGFISAAGITPLAPDNAPAPALSVIAGGTLAPGQYGVALAYTMGGHEGALSAAAYVEIDANQSIRIEALSAPRSAAVDGVRIYRTTANGNDYYLAGEVAPAGTFTLLGTPLGRPADSRYLAALTWGDAVRVWNGRLLVVRGTTLLLSEPMRYGLFSPRYGFVQRSDPIRVVAPTDGALFIATDRDTVALTGRKPDEWTLQTVDCGAPVADSDITLALDAFSGEFATTSARGAVWLTANGYVIGLPDGSVIAPQKQRLALDPMARSRTVYCDRRVLTAEGGRA